MRSVSSDTTYNRTFMRPKWRLWNRHQDLAGWRSLWELEFGIVIPYNKAVKIERQTMKLSSIRCHIIATRHWSEYLNRLENKIFKLLLASIRWFSFAPTGVEMLDAKGTTCSVLFFSDQISLQWRWNLYIAKTSMALFFIETGCPLRHSLL